MQIKVKLNSNRLKSKSDSSRIVNGYSVFKACMERPWIVFIQIRIDKMLRNSGKCGGTIINKVRAIYN